MDGFGHWLQELVSRLGYVEIVLLMALESSLFPVPSELVMIPAGYLAARGELNPWLATLAGAGGSVLGASINYLLGRYVGRAFLLRWGRYLLIDKAKYEDAEALFMRNAPLATFIGRFIPVVRHLISLPAGVFGMSPVAFVLLTGLGAGLWCGVLVALGYCFGEPVVAIVANYTHEASLVALAGLVIFGGWFMLRRRKGPL
ncbi:MAG: DedA family protein [Hydrocarboniphaga sp.]|uniref:DedA family protein n=1 Tax=Hydrocarboniphaga sp. TaxID=2033016 RepID=UPI00262673D2|nr:DedA family protein [Hydrocarboniphaga sp.]MDB5968995.1 DedA family protein [Hydrocarboniphaga sp.]